MSARPANSLGSAAPPFLISSCAETSGNSRRSITITRSPFGRVCSTGFGNATERGWAGGGGVACGVCALMPSAQHNKATNKTVFTQRRKDKEERRKDEEADLCGFAETLRLCVRDIVRIFMTIVPPRSSWTLQACSTKRNDSHP